MTDWAIFFGAAAAIVLAGSVLAICADVVSVRSGLGGLWFGAVVVSLVTSLPELVTDISAVHRGATNLALGDLFGSSMANMAILAGLTVAFRRRRLLQRAALEHVLTAAMAISLIALALWFIVSGGAWSIGRLAGPVAIAVVYVVAMFATRERQVTAGINEEKLLVMNLTLSRAALGFVICGLVIFGAGPLLAESADHLAERTGAGDSFFGSFALALVTSLPELAVSTAAIRLGAVNLAIGNLLGSNATNMALLLPLSLAYSGDLLASADIGVATAGASAIVLMAIGTTSIVLKSDRSRLPVDLAAVAMLFVYGLGLWSVFASRPV